MPNCLTSVSDLTASHGQIEQERAQLNQQRAQLEQERTQLAEQQREAQLQAQQQQQQPPQQQQQQPQQMAQQPTQPCPPAEAAQPALQKQVQFATSSDTLTKSSKATLDDVATAVKQHPDIARVVVTGNTDKTGSSERNQQLGEKRAEVVKNYLAQEGVPEDKIETQSRGDEQPVASNDSASGRALNRNAIIIAVE